MRRWLAFGVIALWVAGLGIVVRREYFRPHFAQLATAAAKINPGSIYFAVMKDGKQVGFASSILDTAVTAITSTDYFAIDLPANTGRGLRRTSVQTRIELSRALHVRRFGIATAREGAGLNVSGRADGDSVMVVTVTTAPNDSVSHRVSVDGQVLLPTLIPLAVAFSDKPALGRRYVLPILDPITLSVTATTIEIRAESLFVLQDSAVFDSATWSWKGFAPDTVRAWHVTPVAGASFFAGWVDDRGRVVATTELGFELRRVPYELGFNNWRMATTHCHMSRATARGRNLDSMVAAMEHRTGVKCRVDP